MQSGREIFSLSGKVVNVPAKDEYDKNLKSTLLDSIKKNCIMG